MEVKRELIRISILQERIRACIVILMDSRLMTQGGWTSRTNIFRNEVERELARMSILYKRINERNDDIKMSVALIQKKLSDMSNDEVEGELKTILLKSNINRKKYHEIFRSILFILIKLPNTITFRKVIEEEIRRISITQEIINSINVDIIKSLIFIDTKLLDTSNMEENEEIANCIVDLINKLENEDDNDFSAIRVLN